MNVKKVFLILSFGFITFSPVFAQSADTGTGDYVRPQSVKPPTNLSNCISFGFGMGGNYPYAGITYSSSPSLSLSFENTTFKHVGPGNISMGVMVLYKQIASTYTDYSNSYLYQQAWNYYMVGARFAYHLSHCPIRNIEPYAGIMGGYYVTRFNVSSTDPHYNEPGDPGYYLTPNVYPNFVSMSVFAGVRSFVSNRATAWMEFGYGYATLAVGATYKI